MKGKKENKMKPNGRNVMTKLYAHCCTCFSADGCDSERWRGGSRPEWHQERGPRAWRIRRWLRLGSRREDPREGWLHGVDRAAPRDLVRRRPKVREGRHRRHGRAGRPGRP